MRSQLPQIARALGADERTLRRATQRGAIRCRRPGARQLELPPGEREYLDTHWDLLATLSSALRTEPNVGFALLFGSAARGDDRVDSDVDLLVQFRRSSSMAAARLGLRLETRLAREVSVFRLDRVRERMPLAVLQALDEGRILLDRDDVWPGIRAQRPWFERAAVERFEADRRAAANSLERLLSEQPSL